MISNLKMHSNAENSCFNCDFKMLKEESEMKSKEKEMQNEEEWTT